MSAPRMALAVAAFALAAGCKFTDDLQAYCNATGRCTCSSGSCCMNLAQECSDDSECCPGTVCSQEGRCAAPLEGSPALLDFGIIDAGSTATLDFVVKNNGPERGPFLAALDGGTAELSATADDCLRVLYRGQSCAVRVQFTPSGGEVASTLLVRDGDGGITAGVMGEGRDTVSLVVSVGRVADGGGTVTTEPGGFCSGNCTFPVPRYTVVTVRADGGPSWLWGGDCADAGAACRVELTKSTHSASATFSPLNRVFVSSGFIEPWDAGIAQGDQLCSSLAAAAGLPGTYHALIGTSQTPITERLGNARGWVRVDGELFGDTVDSIMKGRIFHPVLLDEKGQPHDPAHDPIGYIVPVGGTVNSIGSPLPPPCGDWSTDGGWVHAGLAMGGTATWWSYSSYACAQEWRIYCFGVDYAAGAYPPERTGDLAFISRGKLRGGAGVAAFDSLCQGEAADAGLPGTFRALVSFNGGAAFSRFTASTGWSRVDGIPIAATKTALGEWDLSAGITLFASGEVLDDDYGFAWTGGGTGPAYPPTSDCANWTSSYSLASGGRSGPQFVASGYFDTGGMECDLPEHLYCFQQ